MGKTGNTDLYPLVSPQNDDYIHGYRKETEENVSFSVEDMLNPDGSTQDNKPIVIRTAATTLLDYEAHTVINNTDFSASGATTYYTVSDVQIIVFAIPVSDINGGAISLRTDFWLILNNGKGNYGVGGDIALGEEDVFFLRSGGLTSVPVSENGDPSVVYTFYATDINNPHTAINAGTEVGGYPVTNQGDYYIEVIKLGVSITDAGRSLWKFTGDASGNPVFGADGDGSVAIFADFTLFEIENSKDSKTPKILVNKTVVGSVINGTGVPNDDIHLAVNRSFRGIINIDENELRVFEVQRLVYDTGFTTYAMWLEKYAYTKGKNTISSDSVRDDFELIYERKLTTDISTESQGAQPSAIPIAWTDIEDPAAAINNSDSTYLIDGTNDWVFLIYDIKKLKGLYKIYSFSTDAADYGTYGNNASVDTASNGQLTELNQNETGSEVVTYFEEITPDPYLGRRLKFRNNAFSGFYWNRSANERVGFDVINTSTGNAAVTALSCKLEDVPFGGKATQFGHFGENYFVAGVAGKGHLYSTTAFAFAILENNPWELWFSADDDLGNITKRAHFDPTDDTFHVAASTAAIEANADGKTLIHKDYLDSKLPKVEKVADTASVIDLSNSAYKLANMASPNANTTYTYANEIDGGKMMVLINASSEPVVTGATKVFGEEFTPNTDMYMDVVYNGNRVEYKFVGIDTVNQTIKTRLYFTLSEAELDILNSSPQVIQSKLGADYSIVPDCAFYKYTAGATTYDFGINGIYFSYEVGGNIMLECPQSYINGATDFKAYSNKWAGKAYDNEDLVLTTSANPTQGDGVLEVWVDILIYYTP